MFENYGISTGSTSYGFNTSGITNVSFLNKNQYISRSYKVDIIKKILDESDFKNIIKDIDIIVPDKVVKVIFEDDSYQVAVCNKANKFDLDIGIGICILKYLMGGSSVYHNCIRNAIKLYERKLKRLELEKQEKEELQARIERKKAKNKARREKQRQKRINEMAEAYTIALKNMEK